MGQENRTEIASQTVISGEIEAQEDIVVFGRVEGKIFSSATVDIEEGGVVKGFIKANEVVVSGFIQGDIEGKERVEITEHGRVLGNIATPRIVLQEGGKICGRILMDGSPLPLRDDAVLGKGKGSVPPSRGSTGLSSGKTSPKVESVKVVRSSRPSPTISEEEK